MRSLAHILCLLALPYFVSAGTITLEIRHLWEGEPISIPSGKIETAAGEQVDFTRLAYLVSEPSLVSAENGKRIGRQDWVAYVDAENSVSTLTLTGVPTGNYSKLQFHIGLDSKTDKSDPNQYPAKHPLNPLVNNLHWSPQGGYISLALEGHSSPHSFSYHLGNPRNRVSYEIPVKFQLDAAITLSLDFNVDQLFNTNPTLVTQAQTSTHSRDGDLLAMTLKSRLSNVFSVREVSETSPRSVTKAEIDNNPQAPEPLVGTPYAFRIKKGFPVPDLPTDFPLTQERVDLGAALFHDVRLSKNNSLSCASCHQSDHAFSDPDRLSKGVSGATGRRQSMPLFNLAWKENFFWDGRADSLREQVIMPIEDHLEMDESIDNVIAKLSGDEHYRNLFSAAFGSEEISETHISVAIEQFILTLTSYDSKFDRALTGESELTELEKRGLELFMTEFDPRHGLKGADCFHCHSGPFFSTHRFHNNGLSMTDDTGLMEVTANEADRGKFVTPSLRNIALTAPYMHDGRFGTLEEVVDHYAEGIERSETLDPNLSKHPGSGIPLSDDDKKALVAFLHTLTDERFTHPSNE